MKKYRLPRRPTRPQQPARGGDSPQSDVEKKIDAIKSCYQIGKQFLQYSKSAWGRGKILELAEEKKIPAGEIRKYVRFARQYKGEQLDELYGVFREHLSALTFTHFGILLGVKVESVRKDLTMQAVQGRLSAAGLRRLKERTVGSPKSNGGRRPDLLALDGKDLEEAVNREKEKFRRHLEQVIDRPRSLRADLRERYTTMLKHLQ